MNKGIIIGIVTLLLIGGGVWYVASSKKSSAPSTSAPTTTTTQPTSVFSSIKDALSKSLSLECTFTDETGRQTKSYVKNGAVRADFTATDPKQSGSMIMKDKTIYFWNAQGGFTMAVPEVTPGTTAQTGSATPGGTGNFLETLEKYKNDCKPGVVADSLFTPPTNVTFQDFSKMMIPPKAPAAGNAVPTIDYSQFIKVTPPQGSGY